MVNKKIFEQIDKDMHYQTERFVMQDGMCELSIKLLQIISDMNDELEDLKIKVKKYELDNE